MDVEAFIKMINLIVERERERERESSRKTIFIKIMFIIDSNASAVYYQCHKFRHYDWLSNW